MRWTDDTQMSLDIADSLVDLGTIDCDDIARRFAAGYLWRRGYGPGAAKVLKRIARGEDWRSANRAVFPQGSYGNGGAMRAPVIGLFFSARLDQLPDAVSSVSTITHAHPLAIEGALLVALATALASTGTSASDTMSELLQTARLESYAGKLASAQAWLVADETPTAKSIAARLGNGMAAIDSCVTAIYIALRFLNRPFLEMHKVIVQTGGDVDTIAAMAGGIWGAANGVGELPSAELMKNEQRERLLATAAALFASSARHNEEMAQASHI